jgi:carboxyl-terminal processing protease
MGDVIVGVEGKKTSEMDIDQARNLVRGEENTEVVLTIDRNGAVFDVSVVRKTVRTPVATAKLLSDGIGMITIANFDARCADETIAAIEDLLDRGARKLIFDVRFNPGGYADELVKVLDYLLPEGDLFRTVDYAGKESVDTSDADCLTGIPMAVLVNGDSYSAAEFFAAAMREYDAAVVVGERTVGKGYFQRTYTLSDGSAVGLSVGKYFTPKGVSLAEEGGIVPDVEVVVDEETAAAIYAGIQDPETDPQVLAAIDAMR